VRILASTNRELKKEVELGRFREDLYYRLNVVEIRLPSLSERTADIPLLIDHFVDKHRKEIRKDIKGVTNEVMLLLMQHEWKGEIRELENIIERAVIFAQGEYIGVADLPDVMHQELSLKMAGNNLSLDAVLNDFERQYIVTVLRKHNFDKEVTAQELKISLPTLYRRIKDLDITQ
jgi:two-component system response regulator PilR (NtrC family)